MRIAAGTPVERGRELTALNAEEYLKKLMKESFTGYVCVAINDKHGMEEGILLFKEGNIVASSYAYFAFDKEYKAEQALERALNAFKAVSGIVDCFSLSNSQAELVLTLNDEFVLKEVVTAENLSMPAVFSEDFENKEAEQAGASMSKEDLFKKLGISRKTGERTTKKTLVEKAKQEEKKTEEARPEITEDRLEKLRKLLKR